MVSATGGVSLALALAEETSVVVTPQQERARTRRLLERLRAARLALRQGLLMILEQPDVDAPQLAMELQQAFSLYNSAFLRYHGAAQPFQVSELGGCVVVACGRGRMVLRRGQQEGAAWRVSAPANAWVSAPLGLRGPWLVRYLMSWPGLQVPAGEPSALNDTLMELRGLLHEPCSSSLLRLAQIQESQVSPVVHSYIQDLLSSWPRDFQHELRRSQERAVVEEGLEALRQQMQSDVEALLGWASREHPGDAEALAPPLQGLLNHYAHGWNDAVDDRAHLMATPWRHGEGAAVHIFDVRDETHTHIVWEPRGWVVKPSFQEVYSSLPDLLMRDAPVLDWDEALVEDEGLLWDLHQEDRVAQGASQEARRAWMTPEELQDEADMDWLEENWSALNYYRGLEHRVELDESRCYAHKDEDEVV